MPAGILQRDGLASFGAVEHHFDVGNGAGEQLMLHFRIPGHSIPGIHRKRRLRGHVCPP